MGQVITRLVAERDDCIIVAGFDINDTIKNSYPVYKTPSDCKEAADAILDFSHPSSLDNLLSYAVTKNLPIVVSTTGLSNQQIAKLHQMSECIPIFFSANMSLGVNLLIDLAPPKRRKTPQPKD